MEATELIVTSPDQSTPESADLQWAEATIRAQLRVLDGGQDRRPTLPKLVFENGTRLELSPEVLRALQFVLHHMARGDSFALISDNQMLTTTEAARVLNVSRPFLAQLLAKGEIEYTKVGSHHRMLLRDVLEYKKRQTHRMYDALDQLASEGQNAGNYFTE